MTLRIFVGEIEFALEDNEGDVKSYLDLQTGEVHTLPVDAYEEGDEEYDDIQSIRENEERYRYIQPVGSRTSWRWMEDFALEQEDERLRERLLDAIEGRGAFSRFKRVLHDHMDVREAWFRFRDARLLECAREWLESEGIDAVIVPRVVEGGASA